jgi:hypothetical protein
MGLLRGASDWQQERGLSTFELRRVSSMLLLLRLAETAARLESIFYSGLVKCFG